MYPTSGAAAARNRKAYFTKNFGQEVPTYRNNEELYEKAKPDAVIISTADFQHATHAIEAIAAGCDVSCEKPFAETMQDNRAALKAVKSSDRILQVGSQRRSGRTYVAAYFRPFFRVLRETGYQGALSIEGKWTDTQVGPAFAEIAKQAG